MTKHSVNVVKHLFFNHKNWGRKLLWQLLQRKRRRKFIELARDWFFALEKKSAPIPQKPLDSVVHFSLPITLEHFFSRNGNLSPFELVSISSLVAHRKPKRVLEIGTFDGNTTLQLARNTPIDAIIHTIDLPEGQVMTHAPILDSDIQFILDKKKAVRKFENSTVSNKIRQHFGDSTIYDFSQFTREGLLDFIFIDGGHSYSCVKSDTQNSLKILAKNGCIVWHDFTPFFGGVYQYLCELAKDYPLVNIEQTNLVVLFT